MQQLTLEEAVVYVRNYYKENNLEVPTNVVSYISNFPKGMSRQMIQARYGIKTSEFIKLLNPNYNKPLEASKRVLVECERLGYRLITDPITIRNNLDKVELKCVGCGHIHITTISSLQGSILGCPKCKSGNLPWRKREDELDEILLNNFNAIKISEIPKNESGYLTVVHRACGSEYTSQLLGFINPNSTNRGSCPNCRTTDRRVTVNGITFGSEFESKCYEFIAHLNPEIHIKYSKYFNTTKRWVCDFKIGNYWIEVSNFKVDYKNYFQNIIEKEKLVESNGDHFFFIRTLKEMEEIASLI